MKNTARKSYDSDLTDAQWKLIAPFVEPPCCDTHLGGRPREYARREIVNAMLYINRTGCAWRHLPHDFPRWEIVYYWFRTWNQDGTVQRLHDTLRNHVRERDGRAKQQTAAIIDAQSVKGADTVGKNRRGYDAGKKINGTKRHIAVDTLGLLLVVVVSSATLQDRDGGKISLWCLVQRIKTVAKIWADGGYRGKLVAWTKKRCSAVLEIVKRSDDVSGFEVLPRRWVVERTLSWLTRNRRLCRDYERTNAHAQAWVQWAMIGVMVRRLAPNPKQQAWKPSKRSRAPSVGETAA